MATIRAFSAICPSDGLLDLEILKYRLEPTGSGIGIPTGEDCREYLGHLLEAARYKTQREAIYVYSQQSAAGSVSTGIWALSSLDDFANKKIVPHELTLDQGVKEITTYRKQAGLEGSPVLLCYAGDFQLSSLIERVKDTLTASDFSYEQHTYRLWKVTSTELIDAFKSALAGLGRCYIADGHHRIAAAAALHQTSAQWISSVYMSFDQLDIGPYHRLIRPGSELDRGELVRSITRYYQMAYIPTNRPFLPESKGTMGMYLSGVWYTLSPRGSEKELFELPDAKLLQDRILAPVLGIRHPQSDERLSSFAGEHGMGKLLAALAKDNSLIAFTLAGMSAAELRSSADIGIALPPKSTYISPRMPFGILMRDGKELAGEAGR